MSSPAFASADFSSALFEKLFRHTAWANDEVRPHGRENLQTLGIAIRERKVHDLSKGAG
jgi:hypothetical protein